MTTPMTMPMKTPMTMPMTTPMTTPVSTDDVTTHILSQIPVPSPCVTPEQQKERADLLHYYVDAACCIKAAEIVRDYLQHRRQQEREQEQERERERERVNRYWTTYAYLASHPSYAARFHSVNYARTRQRQTVDDSRDSRDPRDPRDPRVSDTATTSSDDHGHVEHVEKRRAVWDYVSQYRAMYMDTERDKDKGTNRRRPSSASREGIYKKNNTNNRRGGRT